MFKKAKPPKHILFIGEKSETSEFIINVIKESVKDPKEKIPSHTFNTLEINFDEQIRDVVLKRTDGAMFLVNTTNTKEFSQLKEYLWEFFVWNEEARNIPLVVVSYNAEKPLALTTSEIIEGYSLIRLTDRLWNVMEIKENNNDDIISCFDWLDQYIDVIGIKPKILKKKIPSSKESN